MNSLLDYILESEDIFKPVTDEEIPIRRQQYLKSLFDEVKITKNQDGTVDIKGDLDLGHMGLVSLLDLPYKIRKVIGDFYCAHNQLTSLEGAPEQVGGCFSCSFNQLTTLEGAPKIVGGDFWCNYNELTTLEGAPESIGGNLVCWNNELPKNVEIPSKVKGRIYRKYAGM